MLCAAMCITRAKTGAPTTHPCTLAINPQPPTHHHTGDELVIHSPTSHLAARDPAVPNIHSPYYWY